MVLLLLGGPPFSNIPIPLPSLVALSRREVEEIDPLLRVLVVPVFLAFLVFVVVLIVASPRLNEGDLDLDLDFDFDFDFDRMDAATPYIGTQWRTL